MIRITTSCFQKKHRSGAITWIVRWKDPKTGRWVKRAAGRTEDEAKLVEARVRQELALGRDPLPATKAEKYDPTVRVSETNALFPSSACDLFSYLGGVWKDIRSYLHVF
jgi:hypothetical protein